MMHNLFNTLQNLDVGSGSTGSFYSLPQLERVGIISRDRVLQFLVTRPELDR